MTKNNKTILSIVATLLIAVLTIGGTFAFWTWRSGTNTSVGFTVELPEMSASISGSGTYTATNLEPSSCGAGIKETVTITYANPTAYPATLSVDLVATEFKIQSSTYKPSSTNLNYLHWAITKSATCTDPADSDAGRTGITNDTTVTPTTSDNFAEFDGTWASSTTSSSTPTIATISFKVPANTSSTTVTYYLYVWLDKNYTHTNYGTTNSDPMQGLSLKLQWKNGTFVQSET